VPCCCEPTVQDGHGVSNPLSETEAWEDEIGLELGPRSRSSVRSLPKEPSLRILLVEDEIDLASSIRQGLEEEEYSVDVADNGEDGLFLAHINDYDLLILDLLLPKIDGLTITRTIRKERRLTPILMLTAKDALEDKILGLDTGADDYLTKPFAFSELLARIRALLRRGVTPEPSRLQVADLVVDVISHRVMRDGCEIELTSTEYRILEYFVRHPGKVISRTELSEHVWAGDLDRFSNVINVYIYRLRERIDRGFQVKLLHTLRGAGYLLGNPEGDEGIGRVH